MLKDLGHHIDALNVSILEIKTYKGVNPPATTSITVEAVKGTAFFRILCHGQHFFSFTCNLAARFPLQNSKYIIVFPPSYFSESNLKKTQRGEHFFLTNVLEHKTGHLKKKNNRQLQY